MAKVEQQPIEKVSFFASPVVGSVFTILSGLSFLLLAMILPIVGKAAAMTTYAKTNFYAFLGVLSVALLFAVLATISKLERRKIDKSPLPLFSFILCGLCAMLMVALFLGLLKI